MNRWWWNPWFTWPVLVFLAFGTWLLGQVAYGDEIVFWNAFRVQPLNFLFKQATRLGEFWAYLIAVFALLFVKYKYAWVLALTGLTLIPITNSLKTWAKVHRPIAYFEQTQRRDTLVLVPGEPLNRGRSSFPSGHTAGAFALFTTLTFTLSARFRMLGLAFAALAILAGISRIFLVQHFLADVLAGALLGMAVSAALWLPLNKVFGKWRGMEGNLFGDGA